MESALHLAEREGKPIALSWIASAMRGLARTMAGEHDAVVEAALCVSFRFAEVMDEEREARRLHVYATFAAVRGVLADSRRCFAAVSERDALRVFPGAAPSDLPPAYAIYAERVYFTPGFAPYDASTGKGFGPMCRAAMVLHEAVHIIDPSSGAPEVHVSEWDEPRFSSLTPDQALHNPSAYASFAAQVHERRIDWPREARFGAGRPSL